MINCRIAHPTAAFFCGIVLVAVPACQRRVEPQKPGATPPKTNSRVSEVSQLPKSPTNPSPVITASGRELYLQHCAACHGEFGDGDGIATPHLHPRPRSFRGAEFLLVSTESRFPSNADLDAVLVRGMPGSAMPSFAHLSQEERRRLIGEVMRLCREGLRDNYVQSILRNEDVTVGEIDTAEIENFARRRTDPGPVTSVPEFQTASSDSIERGKALYFAKNCSACHGDEGKGDGKKKMVDHFGLPTSPRDFTRGIFKGGHDPQSLYRRVAHGMPGSAMPSYLAVMTPEQIVDVVQYILSLSSESKREAAILRRNKIVSKYVEQLPTSNDSEAWSLVEPTQLRMTPLWWRHGADPDLAVQSLHDGENIAFRLSWRDESEDRRRFDDEDAADIAALELFRGEAEPFIGMGNFGSPVDVWRWTSRLPPPPRVEPTLSGTTNDEESGATKDESSEAPEPESSDNDESPTDPESDPKKKVPVLSVEQQRRMAGAITGYGAGSFSLEFSQLVETQGSWRDGVWTIELRRPMAIKNNLFGVSLEPGCNASIAFAIWNGTQGDIGGKKAITIWQDLHVEAQPTE